MAETRKHHPVVRDDLDRAILAALGENVRPFTPGTDPVAEAPADAGQSAPLRPGHVPPTVPLGVYTVVEPPTSTGQ